MTIKERIEAFVLNQGNQVGAGAELAAILNDILDAIPAAQVQSDWNQASNTKPDFIKNKPTIPSPYTLPPATAETLGGVKVGSGLSVTEQGVLSASGGGQPLIIEGSINTYEFIPNSGQPTFEQAKVAFNNGQNIIFKFEDTAVLSEGYIYAKVTSYCEGNSTDLVPQSLGATVSIYPSQAIQTYNIVWSAPAE